MFTREWQLYWDAFCLNEDAANLTHSDKSRSRRYAYYGVKSRWLTTVQFALIRVTSNLNIHEKSIEDNRMRYKQLSACASVAVLLFVSGCSGTGDRVSNDSGLADQLAAREAMLAQKEADLKARESALSSQAGTPVASNAVSDLLPPNANAGQCFTRIWQPPQYDAINERKLISEAGERIEITPARYGKVKKRVVVQEASTKLVSVPATYRTVSERVLVQPARTVSETVAPVYATEYLKVLDKPAHTVWKKGTGPIQRIDESTGEIMCLVEVPASYKTIEKSVLRTPASTNNKSIKAVYKTVQRRVVDQAASTRTIEIPAKYASVTITEEVSPSQERRIPIEAKYTTVSSRKLVKDGHMDWREILCETNTTPSRIEAIQAALKNEGFDPGSIDGNVGPSTIRAVNAFQRAKGLPVDRYLNIPTVRALGVTVK